jgi:hypothetical protein
MREAPVEGKETPMPCAHTTFETRTSVQAFLASDGVTPWYQVTVEGRCGASQLPLLFSGLPVRPASPPDLFMAVSCSADTQRVALGAVLAAPVVSVLEADAGWQVAPTMAVPTAGQEESTDAP